MNDETFRNTVVTVKLYRSGVSQYWQNNSISAPIFALLPLSMFVVILLKCKLTDSLACLYFNIIQQT